MHVIWDVYSGWFLLKNLFLYFLQTRGFSYVYVKNGRLACLSLITFCYTLYKHEAFTFSASKDDFVQKSVFTNGRTTTFNKGVFI